jgi:hypothetical protein
MNPTENSGMDVQNDFPQKNNKYMLNPLVMP